MNDLVKYSVKKRTLLNIINEFKTDEEIKYNILNKILNTFPKIKKEIDYEMDLFPPQFSILDAVGLIKAENYNTYLLKKLLEIEFKSPNAKEKEQHFFKEFILFLQKNFGETFNFINNLDSIIDVYLKTEERIYTEVKIRKIDLFIRFKYYNKSYAIIIENKINACDQENQINDYYNYNENNYAHVLVIYLTRYGYIPSDYSISNEVKEKIGNNLILLKHSDIARWLEGILENKKYSFLHEENLLIKNNDYKYINDYRLLKSAMIQIIYNSYSLSNETKEFDVTKEKMKKLLEDNIFNNYNTIEELEEYSRLFSNINILFNKRLELEKYLNFSERIINYFNDKKILSENIYYNRQCYLNKVCNNEYIDLIKFNINNNDISLLFHLGSYLEKNDSIIEFYFGIPKVKDNTKFLELRDEIEKISNNFYFDYSNRWELIYFINLQESTEEVSEIIINLYELLKKEF